MKKISWFKIICALRRTYRHISGKGKKEIKELSKGLQFTVEPHIYFEDQPN